MNWGRFLSDRSTIDQLITSAADRTPDRTALEDGATANRMSYRELVEGSDAKSLSLSSIIPPGSRIGLVMESGTALSTWLVAIMWRHTVVPLSPTLTVDEIRRYLALTRTTWLISTTGSPELAEMCRSERITLLAPDAIATAPRANTSERASENAVAAVLLTSGSTSVPKVVPLTHRNLVTGALQVVHSLDLSSDDRALVLWAQHHIGGLVDLLLAPLASGGTIINGGAFSLERFWSLMTSSDPTWIQFVPATLDEVIRDCERRSLSLRTSRLRFVRCVAAPIPTSLWDAAEAAFGCPLVHTYGMTEASPLITSTPLDSSRRIAGSSGISYGTDIRIVDDRNHPVGPNIDGSILLRGDNVFGGYEGESEDLSSSFTDGWFRTGDIGHLDPAGNLFVIGREKNMINRGGEKINPAEVEDALRRHPLVIDAAVFALPHKRLGQIVGAAVSSHARLEPPDLIAFAQSVLAPHKVPAHIQVLESLPRNEVGKIDRLALASQAHEAAPARSRAYRTETERRIARIWADELDTQDISPITPFTIAGGDSLSALRVVAEVENQFSLTGHSRALLRASTIRTMASVVDSLSGTGTVSRDSTRRSTPHDMRWNNRLDIGDFVERITRADNEVTRHQLQHLALSHLCGHEIDVLVREIETANPHVPSASASLIRWRQPTRRIPFGTNSLVDDDWRRRPLHDQVTLYRRTAAQGTGHTVIGFAGMQGRLMIPIVSILANLNATVDAVVVVNDPLRQHYVRGIPDLADDLSGVPRAIVGLLPKELTANLRTIGTSSGGLAAAVAALDLGASTFGLVGADSVHRRPAIRSRLIELGSASNSQTRGRIVSGTTRRDWAAMKDLREFFPLMETRKYLPARHGVMHAAWRFGRIRPILDWLTHDR